jgi:hypothetical protein
VLERLAEKPKVSRGRSEPCIGFQFGRICIVIRWSTTTPTC